MAATPRLLSLPRELRDQIYSYVIPQTPSSVLPVPLSEVAANNAEYPIPTIAAPDYATLLESLPPLARTCNRIYYEFTPLYVAHGNVIFFSDTTSTLRLAAWLSSFGSTAFPKIRRLNFEGFSEEAARLNYAILSHCTNLSYLQLRIKTKPPPGAPRLSKVYHSARDVDVDGLVDSHQLERIGELEKLQRLDFVLPDLFEGKDKSELTRALKDRFLEMFRKWGREGVHVQHGIGDYLDDYDSDEFEGCTMFD